MSCEAGYSFNCIEVPKVLSCGARERQVVGLPVRVPLAVLALCCARVDIVRVARHRDVLCVIALFGSVWVFKVGVLGLF